jgi:hypothetical protein
MIPDRRGLFYHKIGIREKSLWEDAMQFGESASASR